MATDGLNPGRGDIMHAEVSLEAIWRDRAHGRGHEGGGRAALTYTRTGARLGVAEVEPGRLPSMSRPAPCPGRPVRGAIALALVSAMSSRSIRGDLAATGEITLRGRVLPIGGVKEKVPGAHRAGITDIVLPRDNEGDLEDVAEEVRSALRSHLVEMLDEAIGIALRV